MRSEIQDLHVQVGRCFDITLLANPTTGYSWSLKTAPSNAHLVNENTEMSGAYPGRLGAASVKQIFHFKAKQVGSEILRFQYERAWEPFRPAEGEHAVRVTIDAR